ncbi:hypothetical protein [Streptomyces sp. V4I2]|uniref:hypothetical protein n=1 Tax=Streptomyces sp. V4I2 TaxID=3042280 RepID=UPI0027835779|nr:hypothetical protein [Streptomyces sp. V4I2]MDQ1051517.1 hypothetical protein [Streptomyces sp. V4I2]
MTTSAFTHHSPHGFVDPYAVDTTEAAWQPAPATLEQNADYLLPPPNPAHRLGYTLNPRDQRRLALHAALTTAGIPPRPEDRDAIDQLSALPNSINTTLQRWLHHTT